MFYKEKHVIVGLNKKYFIENDVLYALPTTQDGDYPIEMNVPFWEIIDLSGMYVCGVWKTPEGECKPVYAIPNNYDIVWWEGDIYPSRGETVKVNKIAESPEDGYIIYKQGIHFQNQDSINYFLN